MIKTEQQTKKFNPLSLVILLLIVLVVGGAVWYWHDHKSNSVSSSNSSSSEPITWINYSSVQYGLGFTYPKSWGDVQIHEAAAETGNQYGISFLQNAKNTGNAAVAISMDSNDLKATFCKSAGSCVSSGGITKSTVEQQLKSVSGIVKKDATSYATIINLPQEKISGMTFYQIVSLPKINVSAVVINYQKTKSGVNCPGDRLADNSTETCITQSDYATFNKMAKSIHSL